MPEPVTISALAIAGLGWMTGAAAGGAVGSVSDRTFCSVLRGTKDRIAGLQSLPENHDIARAVRLAQIQALERLIGDFHNAPHPDWREASHTRPEMFFERSQAFCARAIGRSRDFSVKLNLDVTAPLTSAIDRILAPPAGEGPADQRTAAVAMLAEDVVLDELREALDGVRLPDGFEEHFRRGTDTGPRFLDLFGAYISEQIKENDRFRSIFITGRLSEIVSLAIETREFAARIEERFGPALVRIETTVERIATTQDEHGAVLADILARISTDKGVAVAPLRAILTRLGEAEVPIDQIPARLAVKAEEYLTLREQWSKLGGTRPDLMEVREKALERIDAGDFDAARELYAEARRRIREARQDRSREEAALLADEAQIDRLEVRYPDAAEKYAEAATLVSFDSDARFGYVFAQADVLQAHGKEFGDNPALRSAIKLYEAAADLRPRHIAPLAWAATQNNLGNALRSLGARESGTERLEEAVAAYRAALEERTRERVPLDWAGTQNNLGNALATLGARESGTERLEEAVVAYRAALEEHTRERVPLDWAGTQNNLGNALQSLGARESGTERLEEAVTAYRAALEEYTRERVPLDWAGTQNNLGNALQSLGARESGTERLEEAVAAYRAALEEYTRERVPLDWAMTQSNLGNALRSLGARESGTERLEEAVVAYRAALEEYTRERVPLDWAGTQNNLGSALLSLGARESGTERLEEAVAACRAALEEYTRERVPLDWAMTQSNLGNALRSLGARESGTERLEEAVVAYRAALEEYTRERVPLDWAGTQNNLGSALLSLGARESGTERLEEAVAACRAALEERTRERVPLDWAGTQNNLGSALASLGARESGTERLEEAVAAYRKALQVFESGGHDYHIGVTRANLARAEDLLAQRRG